MERLFIANFLRKCAKIDLYTAFEVIPKYFHAELFVSSDDNEWMHYELTSKAVHTDLFLHISEGN